MSAITLDRPRSFWVFDGTEVGASTDATAIQRQYASMLVGFADGSATGRAQIGGPIQAIYAVQRECSAENWNGAGASAIPLEAANFAKRLLLALPSYLPAPDFYGDPSGAISFEWYRRPKHRLVISVYSSGRIEYAGLLGVDNEIYGALRMGGGMPKILSDHLRQLFTRQA